MTNSCNLKCSRTPVIQTRPMWESQKWILSQILSASLSLTRYNTELPLRVRLICALWMHEYLLCIWGIYKPALSKCQRCSVSNSVMHSKSTTEKCSISILDCYKLTSPGIINIHCSLPELGNLIFFNMNSTVTNMHINSVWQNTWLYLSLRSPGLGCSEPSVPSHPCCSSTSSMLNCSA